MVAEYVFLSRAETVYPAVKDGNNVSLKQGNFGPTITQSKEGTAGPVTEFSEEHKKTILYYHPNAITK